MGHHPGSLLFQAGIDGLKGRDPDFDIAALGAPHSPLCCGGQVGQVAILNPDQIRFVEGEVQMEFDQACEGGRRVGRGIDHRLPALHQPGTHLDQ